MTSGDVDTLAVAEARRWIGTPYRHQGTTLGVGCDCLGLIRGVWRAIHGDEPCDVPAYTPDWAEWRATEPLLDAAVRYLRPARAAGPGTVLLFRWSAGSAIKHCGIQADADTMIHAYAGHGVVRSPLVEAWRRRIVARFAFPEPTPPFERS